MKEYIKKEKKIGKYEYGYRIQIKDLNLINDLGIKMPSELYNYINSNYKLYDYIYFNNPIIVEFLARQYYIRDYIDFVSLNKFELELLINYEKKNLQDIVKRKKIIKNKDLLNKLETDLIILKNEIEEIDNVLNKEDKIYVRK